MLLQPRVYGLAKLPQQPNHNDSDFSFFQRTHRFYKQKAEAQEAKRMLLVHQAGSVKVGEVVRYTLTYTPSNDRILPTPSHLHLKIKNTCAIPLRAAWIHGPYALHVSTYPTTFNPHHKVENFERDGIPQYEPMLKAGGSWQGKLTVPDNIRETGADLGKRHSISSATSAEDDGKGSMTWVIEIASQILFSNSASVEFEVLVGRDERSLDLGFAAIAGHGHAGPGKMKDTDKKRHRGRKQQNLQTAGVYSKAIKLVAEDTETLWNKPGMPTWEDDGTESRKAGEPDNSQAQEQNSKKPRRRKKLHLVIVTHGMHSNVGADMLFLKESIDATVKQARIDARKRKANYRAERSGQPAEKKSENEDGSSPADESTSETGPAPVSGGQEELDPEDDDDDEEETIVRGYSGNAVRTENGIQYLGKRLAKYILKLTYPDQPFIPVKRTLTKHLTDSFKTPVEKARRDGKPAHQGSSVHIPKQEEVDPNELPYKFTSISFVGHSLGGLIQTYAVAYIHKHSPTFFQQIEPINFICMASPMLGLSNENPMYIKFALDFGLVGRTGQDLGLTWRPPTLAKGGWNAVIGGLGSSSTQKDQKQPDPSAKPLLRILPTGPAHQVLRMFRNRTVYSNVVNDGIVPLRTSCLLFLDWRGLGKVDKARRENGLIGTVAGWGWAELTGANSSTTARSPQAVEYEDDDDDDDEHVLRGEGETVPLPAEDETADDNKHSTHRIKIQEDETSRGNSVSSMSDDKPPQHDKGMLDQILGFFRTSSPPRTKTSPKGPSKKTSKALRRGQTVAPGEDDLPEDISSGMEGTTSNPTMRPHIGSTVDEVAKKPKATRGDSFVDPTTGQPQAPPTTSIFESAGDILHPPMPSTRWITDPGSRARTIFHDRVYHPEDIPPPPVKKHPSRLLRSVSSESVSRRSLSITSQDSIDSSGMKVEEKIARAYHRDLSWRKVLVRLEPDAHNNMIVRRMFANAYGWPVVKHLCDTHFADTYSAKTRDEAEPAKERAPPMDKPISSDGGEEVEGQTDRQPPTRTRSEMREAQDELADLSKPQQASLNSQRSRLSRGNSISSMWDDAYFEGSDGEDSEVEDRGLMYKLINHATGPAKPAQTHQRHSSSNSNGMPTTPTRPYTDGHRGLTPTSPTSSKASRADHNIPLQAPTPTKSTYSASDMDSPIVGEQLVAEPEPLSPSAGIASVGLRKPLEEQVSPVKAREAPQSSSKGVSEAVARLSSGRPD